MCMARLRRAWRCAARDIGRAEGQGACCERVAPPPWRLGASSRRRLVAALTTVPVTKLTRLYPTSIPPKK